MLTEGQMQQLRQFILQQREEYLQDMMADGGLGGGGGSHMLRMGGKRDPLKGFMGVRGKRLLERLAFMEDQLKHSDAGPTMGFVGMRGKKWTKPSDTSAED